MNDKEVQEIYAALLSQAKHYQDLRADILKQAAVYERMLKGVQVATVNVDDAFDLPVSTRTNITYTIGGNIKK